MKGFVFIDNEEIGFVNFKKIDESMGVIGGDFFANENYIKFKKDIQKLTSKYGNSNSVNYNFKVLLNNIKLNPFGGISLVDSEEFNEMYLDAAGLDENIIEKVK
nr:hypothetical protein [uncultured Flavobacterium sp.]